jgi:hypothetical protein
MKRKILAAIVLIIFGLCPSISQTSSIQKKASPVIRITSKMPPPVWALEERKLFALYDTASRVFAEKYLDEKGYLRVVERWGGNDGPDDAMENFSHWPLLYALGGPDILIKLYQKAWEGHIEQYTKARIPDVEMAKNGMYHNEFITSFDWEHNGEGLSAFCFYGLVNPDDPIYKKRMIRFAGLYLNEDPEAQNYDPQNKIILSLHNGSLGPKMTNATEMDWGGESVPGYPDRLTRYSDAGNIRGDHPLNLIATTLAMNAYMLTGDNKYRSWILEYTDAWRRRIIENNGNIPSNIGLDGRIGGEWDGKWYGGTFGWNFDPKSNVRNYTIRGPRIGMGNALMLTGDKNFIIPLRQQMQNLYDAKKMADSTILLPNKYGDNGWYGYIRENQFDVLQDIYLWSMDAADLKYLKKDPWITYLSGKNVSYPETAIQREKQSILRTIRAINQDTSRQQFRPADGPQRFNPVKAGTLARLTTGGNDPGIAGNIFHCRVRYFDPLLKRAGVPEDVAALVQKISADGIELFLVNTNPKQPRQVIIQAGAYGEHQFSEVAWDNKQIPVDSKTLTFDLSPGAGSTINLKMKLFANTPGLTLPW